MDISLLLKNPSFISRKSEIISTNIRECYLIQNHQTKASILVIGNEILSGRTKDKNIGYIAEKLTENGINLLEARIIADSKEEIKSNILELSSKYDYVFTSGGIGPTHDDITTESIAYAFNLELEMNKEALKRLKNHYYGKKCLFMEIHLMNLANS